MPRQPVFLCALLLVPAAVLAQGGGWEIEVHGGGMLTNNVSGGTGSLPDPGSSFTTVSGFPSRRVSSWFFGDGAELLNGVATEFMISQRITPLDPVLTNSLAEQQGGGSFGFRVSREITPRFAAEFNFDYVSTPLEITSGAASGIQASSASFEPVFNGVFATGPFVDPSVTSVQTIQDGEGTQIIATGALNINLMTQGRFIPYATVGAGVINTSDTPTASLEGTYSFVMGGTAPGNEMDRVTLAHSIDDNRFVGVVGGGIKVLLTPRSGIRVDVRVHLSANTIRTLLDAHPEVARRTSNAFPDSVAVSRTNPSIQFSNNPARGQSSLSGPDLNDFQSFSVSGMQREVLVTAGYFWRF